MLCVVPAVAPGSVGAVAEMGVIPRPKATLMSWLTCQFVAASDATGPECTDHCLLTFTNRAVILLFANIPRLPCSR
jgi:hypothetical protein